MKIMKIGTGGALQAKQNELAQIEIEKLNANLDWVALMADIELPENEKVEQERENKNE